ncbi:hypothetical protein ACFE04_015033 [Oxalis oulophora]
MDFNNTQQENNFVFAKENYEVSLFSKFRDLSIDDVYINSFPPGFRFCPTDEELIVEYLTRKIKNLPLPANRIIEVVTNQFNPEDLIERYKKYGENEWYFFSPTFRKYKNGGRPNRAAGDGYWKATGADKAIESGGLGVVGVKKTLVFYKCPKDKTNWIMHEYRVPNSNSRKGTDDMKLDDWVLCRIYKNVQGSNPGRARISKHENSVPLSLPEQLIQPIEPNFGVKPSNDIEDDRGECMNFDVKPTNGMNFDFDVKPCNDIEDDRGECMEFDVKPRIGMEFDMRPSNNIEDDGGVHIEDPYDYHRHDLSINQESPPMSPSSWLNDPIFYESGSSYNSSESDLTNILNIVAP